MVGPMGVLASLKKNQLVKKGFACSKTRRKPVQNQFLRSLESSGQVKTLIFLVFLVGLAALIFYGARPQQAKQFLFALLVFFTALAQLWINHPQTFAKNSLVALMFGTFLVHLTVMKALLVFINNGTLHPRRSVRRAGDVAAGALVRVDRRLPADVRRQQLAHGGLPEPRSHWQRVGDGHARQRRAPGP